MKFDMPTMEVVRFEVQNAVMDIEVPWPSMWGSF